jgi:5-methylcytosine-specific restriction endonuclease McrA
LRLLPFGYSLFGVDYIDEHHGFIRKREAKARFREQILKGWDYKCAYCREPLGKSGTLDHVRPKVKGGETLVTNLVACCFSCNSKKSSSDWAAWFREQDFWEPHLEDAVKWWLSQ